MEGLFLKQVIFKQICLLEAYILTNIIFLFNL